jgi:predicted short-subunit dehydrogenase-like oxidoreductase (DUF2520 family)
MTRLRVAIIGTGRLGTSLGTALARAGAKIEALADIDPRAARRARRRIGGGFATTDPVRAAAAAGVVFLCVPDDAIRPAAAALAGSAVVWRGKIVFHTSGLTPASALGPLRAKGASTASFHPVQTFPIPSLPPSWFKGIAIGIEGDRAASALARTISRALGARPLRLAGRDKALYHAACSLASNLLVPLFDLACETLARAGVPESKTSGVLLPLVEGTLHAVKLLNGKNALTGPLARGDLATVRRHLGALKGIPLAADIYRLLGKRSLVLLEERGISKGEISRLRERLEEK